VRRSSQGKEKKVIFGGLVKPTVGVKDSYLERGADGDVRAATASRMAVDTHAEFSGVFMCTSLLRILL
jgi:hypothetical protein